MKDLGIFKTVKQETYRCHFDAQSNEAIAMGPLPEVNKAFRVEANSEKEAVEKLSEKIGQGVMVDSTAS
jgi:hypothetical protein